MASFRNRSGERREGEGSERRGQGEGKRKGGRVLAQSLTGILMRLNLCISSVCNPGRGWGRQRKGRV